MSWPTVQRALVAYGQRERRRSDPWETGFVDLAGGQALLGEVEGRSLAAARAWLAQRSPEFRA